jgi:hypothetical protein
MRRTFMRLFRDHPKEVDETYLEHMAASSGYGWRLLKAASMAYWHALVPGMCKTAASDRVRAMAAELNGRAIVAREERMRQAGVFDPGL